MPDLIQGVTRLSNAVYILHARDADQIDVYTTECEYLRCITVPGLNSSGVCDIVSSEHNACLYLSNVNKSYIHVVTPKVTSNKITKWTLSEIPCGLSVMRSGRLLVTCVGTVGNRKLIEFNSRGKSVRSIILDSAISQPYHSIQLASGNYAICCAGAGESIHQVCIVNSEGKIERRYGSASGGGDGQLNSPTHIAVDEDEFVFVADRDNARIVLLSPSLQFVSYVLPSELHRKTNHVYIDRTANRLYASSSGMFDQRRSIVTVVQL